MHVIWNESNLKLLEKLWYEKNIDEITKIFGVSRSTIYIQARKLELPSRKQIRQVVENETEKENNGRKATHSIQNIKNSMVLNKRIKLKDYVSSKNGYKRKQGTIVGVTDEFIVVKTRNYKETFKFSDILTRKTIVEDLE